MNFQFLLNNILKNNLKFKKNEFFLSSLVFLYLLSFKFFPIQDLFKKEVDVFLIISFSFLLLENYITTTIYYGVKVCSLGKNLIISDIFKKGIYFFPRILLYKILLGFLTLFFFTFASGLIEILKSASLLISSIIFIMVVGWVSIPFYFLFLTLFTPLIILFDDEELFPAVKRSFVFMRKNLKEIAILGIIFLIIWAGIYYFSKETSSFAYSELKVYNIKNLVRDVLFSYFIAGLEIYTVKVFMSYYLKRSGNGYSI